MPLSIAEFRNSNSTSHAPALHGPGILRMFAHITGGSILLISKTAEMRLALLSGFASSFLVLLALAP